MGLGDKTSGCLVSREGVEHLVHGDVRAAFFSASIVEGKAMNQMQETQLPVLYCCDELHDPRKVMQLTSLFFIICPKEMALVHWSSTDTAPPPPLQCVGLLLLVVGEIISDFQRQL